jgi:hypothetical protein
MTAGRFEPRLGQAFGHFGCAHRALHLGIETVDDRPRRAGGKREREVGRHERVLAAARLGERRDVRHQRRTLRRPDRERAHAAVTHEAQHRGRGADRYGGFARRDRLHRRADALVRDVHEVDAEARLERLDVSAPCCRCRLRNSGSRAAAVDELGGVARTLAVDGARTARRSRCRRRRESFVGS